MEWEKLLSTGKLVAEDDEPEEFSKYPINEFEKDYNRIVSSAAFRRLQDKTQVFPLDKSDFVRTRLTHSIEVSTIARQLGIMISKNKTEYRPKDINEEFAEGISSVLLCAGLLHDLGNPPFGHFGEVIIGDWFKEHLDSINYKDKPLRKWLDKQMAADLENFEGNAQALRILLKAKNNSEINLSMAIISTLVKYPTNSLSYSKDDSDIKKHKLGYYKAEKGSFLDISKQVGTSDDSEEICRHPLTFLLEAADDIAYATADLEDAFKKGLFSLDSFIKSFKAYYDANKVKKYRSPEYFSDTLIEELNNLREDKHTTDSQAFRIWLNYTRRWLMYVSAYSFSHNYESIMNGTYKNDLFVNTHHSITINALKNVMDEFVFNSPGILKLELSAQTILSFLLEKFVHAVLYSDEKYQEKKRDFAPSKADKKYLSILPENYNEHYNKTKNEDEGHDLYLRLLMVTDYISGMTDSYARNLYRELSGIE